MNENEVFSRSQALLGEANFRRLKAAHVLIVGVGGVGSWCAEALVRTGLSRLTLVDDDSVAESNLNRQCPATLATLGAPKVEAMAERLVSIVPDVSVTPIVARFPSETFGPNSLTGFDVIVDAIDSVDAKAELLLSATAAGLPVVSSMGAALRTDPTRVVVSRFEKVTGDGLAKALRNRFKRLERFPSRFTCVWSEEPPLDCPIRGSLMTVTATFGMCLATEVIRILTKGER